jgi:hypothetical protein
MNLAGPNGTTLPLNQNGSGATRFSSDYREVVWLSRRSAMEYAGFLEWLWRLGGAPCEVVDLTDLRISIRPPQPPVLAVSVAALSPDQIRGNNLWDLAEPLQMRARGSISRSLATASFGKRAVARDRWRKASVGSNNLL